MVDHHSGVWLVDVTDASVTDAFTEDVLVAAINSGDLRAYRVDGKLKLCREDLARYAPTAVG